MLHHPLTNFKIQRDHQNDARFNGVYSINHLLVIKYRAYAINIHEYKCVGTHWIVWYVNHDNVTYFDSFGVEQIPKTDSKKYSSWFKNFTTNIYEVKVCDSNNM